MSYDANHRLTYEGAKQAIQSGGSVSIGGKLHTSIDTLPNEFQLSSINAVTRAQAEQAIRIGGAFTYNGKTYTDVAKLPSAEEFEAGNRTAQQASREKLQKEISDRQAQLDEAANLDRQAADLTTRAANVRSARAAGPTAPNPDDLDAMKVAELREQAKAANIHGASTLTKAELIDALSKQQQVNSGNLDVLTVAELKERANAAGIQNASGMTKAELVDALKPK